MHAPYAAQYCVIGGSGAGSGGSFTPDAAAVCAAPAAAVPEAPLSALVADAGVAAAVVAVAVVELAVFVAAAVVAVLTPAPLAAGAAAAAGMLAPGGVAEKLLEGKGGRDGAPVDDVLVAAGLRGGSCDSCAMLILVCLLAVA
ncbi:hypothetical protein FSO04_09800 [Paraburkholderia madseniana]|jgi:hypothetical protein|uniref:Uncharacterized protein n=1 Tax=Paraburkholderia madseniana TaxID=2599607 RepID=A0A6N6WL87_9BURK|nr:hypothetical protein FSO04_09800 [Paraburkholderia madseniana]NPT66569.1 hypothetical protein [Paraburkholderia madseniana]